MYICTQLYRQIYNDMQKQLIAIPKNSDILQIKYLL